MSRVRRRRRRRQSIRDRRRRGRRSHEASQISDALLEHVGQVDEQQHGAHEERDDPRDCRPEQSAARRGKSAERERRARLFVDARVRDTNDGSFFSRVRAHRRRPRPSASRCEGVVVTPADGPLVQDAARTHQLMSFFSSLRISMPNCARTASWGHRHPARRSGGTATSVVVVRAAADREGGRADGERARERKSVRARD